MTRARFLMASLLVATPLAAQQPTPAALNAVLDSLGPAAVASAYVPGAVVAIVRVVQGSRVLS